MHNNFGGFLCYISGLEEVQFHFEQALDDLSSGQPNPAQTLASVCAMRAGCCEGR